MNATPIFIPERLQLYRPYAPTLVQLIADHWSRWSKINLKHNKGLPVSSFTLERYLCINKNFSGFNFF